MANRKDQLKNGISAMFGDGQDRTPNAEMISEEQYEILERRQSERRYFMTGSRRNDDTSERLTRNDIRTCMILDKDQYDVLKEIALREAMTIKDLAFAIFQYGIEGYERKYGKVIVRESMPKKNLF